MLAGSLTHSCDLPIRVSLWAKLIYLQSSKGMYIPFEDCKYINFAHRAGRMGKSQEWVNDPDNIFFSCSSHHIEEESTGVRMEGVEYDDEIVYVPCED